MVIYTKNYLIVEKFFSTKESIFQNSNVVSENLMYVDLPIQSKKVCRELFVNVTDLPAGMFCAGYLEGGRDSCQVTKKFFYL